MSNMNQNNYHTTLQRQPSQSPASSQASHDHQPTPTSSSSSLEPSPHPSHEPYPPRHQHYARQSFEETVPDEFNPHPGTLSSLDSTKASGFQNSLRRPGPPPLSHTAPYQKTMSPSLRQSASFSSNDRLFERARSGSESGNASSKRYSDDANGGKSPAPWKKKSGISSFFGSVLGSPRSSSVKISAPENPVHVTHVGFDNQTGLFTVRTSIASKYRSIPPDIGMKNQVAKNPSSADKFLLLPVLYLMRLSHLSGFNAVKPLIHQRVYLKNGNECCKKVEYRKQSKSATPKQLSTS